MAGNAIKLVGGALCLAVFAFAAPQYAEAESPKTTQISIKYHATLASVYVGTAQLQIALTKQAYTISASGSTSGILDQALGFKLSVKSHGTLANDAMIPQQYSIKYGTRDAKRSITINYNQNRTAEVLAKPPFFPSRFKVPLTPDHLKNTIDLLSALFMPVKENIAPLSPDNCQRQKAIFDGRIRYVLKISSVAVKKPHEKFRGFKGPTLVCKFELLQIAGHRRIQRTNKKWGNNNVMEIWLTPVKSAKLLIPVKSRLTTRLGVVELTIRRLYLNGQKVAAL